MGGGLRRENRCHCVFFHLQHREAREGRRDADGLDSPPELPLQLTRWKVKTGEWWDEGAFAVGTTLAGMAAWKRSRRATVMVEVVGGRAGWRRNLTSGAVSSAWNAGQRLAGSRLGAAQGELVVFECGYYRCGSRRGRLAGEATAQTTGTDVLALEGELLLEDPAESAEDRGCAHRYAGLWPAGAR